MKVEKELTKLYYSISEVSEMFGVTNSLVRYWETEFTQLKPKKSRRGDRQYMVKDIRVIERIYTLVKERGFTLDGARKELKSKKPLDVNKKHELLSKLQQIKSRLDQLSKNL